MLLFFLFSYYFRIFVSLYREHTSVRVYTCVFDITIQFDVSVYPFPGFLSLSFIVFFRFFVNSVPIEGQSEGTLIA